MQRTNETVVITRQRVGQFASYVTGVALLAGVLGLIWTGLSALTLVSLVLAVLGLITWGTFAPRDFRATLTGKQARFSAVAFFSTLLLVGIIVMTYLLVRSSAITFDLTQSQQYTLSQETLQVLNRVTRPIQITGFYSSTNLLLREIDDQFFRLYETATNGLIRRQYIDPDEAPALAQRLGIRNQNAAVFISYVNEDGSINFETLSPVARSASQERDMTEAILRLLIAGTVKVYFDTSHGSRDALDTSPEGLTRIHGGMQQSGFVTGALDISQIAAQNGDIPPDANVVLIVRPLTDFSQNEVAVVDRYLDRGGTLFIMADLLFTPDAFLKQGGIFSEYLWANYGIRALDAAVVDPIANTGTALDVLSYAVVSNTVTPRLDPAVDPVRFRLARALEVSTASPLPTVFNGRFIDSSPGAFGETDLQRLGDTNTFQYDEGQDLVGPLTLAAWAYDDATGARVLLVGDSDYVANGQIAFLDESTRQERLRVGNGLLFTDGVTWLTDVSRSITFAPVSIGFGLPLVTLDEPTRAGIAFVVVVLIPGILLVSGLAIWARRSRR